MVALYFRALCLAGAGTNGMDVNAALRTLWGMQCLASSPSAVVVHQHDLIYQQLTLRVYNMYALRPVV